MQCYGYIEDKVIWFCYARENCLLVRIDNGVYML